MGWSDGGIVALLVALARPDLVRKLVVIGANYHRDGFPPPKVEPQSPRSTVEGRLAADRRGAGAPLVLLHALGSSRHVWDPVIPAISEHFDVIAVDLPTPLYCRISLRATRWLTTHIPGVLNRAVNYRLGRILVLGQSHGRPARMSPMQARAAIRAMASCVGFDATLAATIHRRYTPQAPLNLPVTVAFGSRDRILPLPQWRRTDMLPSHAIVE